MTLLLPVASRCSTIVVLLCVAACIVDNVVLFLACHVHTCIGTHTASAACCCYSHHQTHHHYYHHQSPRASSSDGHSILNRRIRVDWG